MSFYERLLSIRCWRFLIQLRNDDTMAECMGNLVKIDLFVSFNLIFRLAINIIKIFYSLLQCKHSPFMCVTLKQSCMAKNIFYLYARPSIGTPELIFDFKNGTSLECHLDECWLVASGILSC